MDEPLNNSVPLPTLYRSLVKEFARQNRYIDKLEAENKELRHSVDNKKIEIKFLKEKIARHNIVQQYGGDVEQMYKAIEEGKEKRKNMQTAIENFAVKHRGKDLTINDIREFFEALEANSKKEE